ncbi:orotidine-5'-phosphate decarboxylase [Longimonas halophila]|uniref:Orotidine 5'-phosphate decarboxylase n=1 Tax=Longimonas halophila TaxID=1469170 RepID=A0A2H3NX38_9BACT|nr:orotidine-5'-phosphate decarboxylase [Longimonas halophila]PEN06687.1 orotidine-5'-phosphate decarboxylase [Longimonas halophila]
MSFVQRLRTAQHAFASRVCVGLDPVPERLPAPFADHRTDPQALADFCIAIIEATAPHCCAYKPNLAFFEAQGAAGYAALESVIEAIPNTHLCIADAKRGDIGHTARFYARGLFDHLGADAITAAPYMGRDSILPFLRTPERGVFVLTRTSNAGSADLQECPIDAKGDLPREPVYQRIARLVQRWSAHPESEGDAGLVVGATAPEALAELREVCPALPFLIPGVGAQGGDASAVVDAAVTNDGLILVNSSRSIIYASDGDDFADAAAEAAAELQAALG